MGGRKSFEVLAPDSYYFNKGLNMRFLTFVFVACISLLTGCAKPHQKIPLTEIGQRTIVLGLLGRPIGEELTIHGRKQTPRQDNGGNSFLVDRVNGQKFDHPVGLNVLGINHWPEGTEATIRGYEDGEIRYEHIDDGNWSPDNPRFKPRQIILMTFAGTAARPPNLELKEIYDLEELIRLKTNGWMTQTNED
jgi:hypothetical protein